MVDFDRLALTAQRLIAANGRSVTVIKYGNAPQDSEKPWRGQSEYPEAEVVGIAAFVPRTQMITTRATNEDGALRETEYALFAGEDDTDLDLETFHAIEDNGRIWRIVSTEVLVPASTRVLYMFEVKR